VNCDSLTKKYRSLFLFKLSSKLVGEVDVIEEQNNNVENQGGESGSADSSGNDSLLSQASAYDELFSDDLE